MAMRVLLIRPDPGNARFGLGPFFRVEPLGLEYIAAALRAGGHEATVVDERLDRGLAGWLKRLRPDVVGIAGMHALEFGEVLRVARMAKRLAPQAFLLAGGHAAAAHPAALEAEPLDAICTDDGEEVVP